MSTFTIEDIGNFCPPCPAPIADDGRYFFLVLLWIGVALLVWPRRSLRVLKTNHITVEKKETWAIAITSVIALVFAGIGFFFRTDPYAISRGIGGLLSLLTSAPIVQACLGCADLQRTVYSWIAAVLVPLEIISAIALFIFRSRVQTAAKNVPSITPHIGWPLTIVLIAQILTLVPLAVLAFVLNM